MRWGDLALVTAVALLTGVYFIIRGPSYTELRESCYGALAKSPRSETLDAWLKANRISASHRTIQSDESFKEFYVSDLGIPAESVDKAVTCTSFQIYDIRGGLLSVHTVYGYFLFSADGSLVDSHMYDIYYGM